MLKKNVLGAREDLSNVIDVLLLKDDDMKFLSLVNFLPKIKDLFGMGVTAQKHEWIEDSARAETLSCTASGSAADWDTNSDITALPVAAGEIVKLRVGDVLLLPTGDEVVVVKSIDLTGNTIDLYSRGHGSSTATAQGTSAFTVKIVGNAQVENGDPLDGNFTTQVREYNYTQIFEDVADVSGTVARSNVAGGKHLDYQVVKKTKELLRLFNSAMWEGLINLDTTNNVATMGGLREYISNTSNVGGSITMAKLYTAVVSHIEAGLYPSAIHGSPTAIAQIEQLYAGSVRTKVSDTKHGVEINSVVIMGYEIELHVDKHIRSSEAFILDYNRIAYGPLDGDESGEFAVYDLLDKQNGKQRAKQVLGEYTLRVSNGGGTRLYGIS